MQQTLFLWAAAAAGFAWGAMRLRQRIALSRAKHRSLAGHARIARRIARLIPGYAYDEEGFFASDDPEPGVTARRRLGFERLCMEFERRHPIGTAMTVRARASLPDLQLTGRYRVPFQYAPYLRSRLTVPAFMQGSSGQQLQDVDGNRFHDLSGSYGVNLLGYDTYKRFIDEGARKVRALGPVLGSLHPCVLENVEHLRRISGLDDVSFHMSGTEAVMQAVRLARYHTGRSHVVRFAGAYHGWWEDVQPGPGNPSPVRDTYTLADGSERTLHVLATRTDIACVLVNPLQALHPNASAPGDSTLVDSSRRAGVDRSAYAAWLRRLREVCSERGIVLILDEVFTGFRLARGGAQEYFDVRADMVTYGKTLGGGLPVGVVCGRADLMKRFREERPADLCFARGTFNAHPYVMGAMNAFLEHFSGSEVQALYDGLDARWNARAARLNAQLNAAGMPVRVAALSTIWTVLYTRPSRYNWMLQFYLRLHGLALSWVGTGRLIFSMDCDDDAFEEVLQRFVRGCRAMHEDGWWDGPATEDRRIRRSILIEMLREATGRRSAPRSPHRVQELATHQREG